MHTKKFRKLIIVLGISTVALLGGCLSEGKGYHQLAESIRSLERNNEINIQGFAELPNKFHQDIEKIGLIQDSPVTAKSYIQDSIFVDMLDFFQHAYNFKKTQASLQLPQLESQYQLSQQSPYLYFYSKNLISKGISLEDLQFIQNAELDQLSIPEQYLLISTLLELGTNSLIGIPFQLRITLLHYAIYIVEKSRHPELFSNLKAKILYNKARQMIGESKEYIPLSIQLLNDSHQIFTQNSNEEMELLTKWYENFLSQDSISHEILLEFIITPISPREKIGPLIEMCFLNLHSEPEEAIINLNEAMAVLAGNTCTYHFQLIANGLAEIALIQLDTIKAINILQKASNISHCNKNDYNLIKYKNLQIVQPTLNALLEKNVPIANFQTLLKEKEMGHQYLHNDPQHWDDYLSYYGFRVLKNFSDVDVTDPELIIKILEIAQQSKEREIQNIRKEDNTEEWKKSQYERTLLLDKIDDFKSRVDYGNEAYKQFFDYQVEHFGENAYQAIDLKELNFEKTLPQFEKTNTQLLGFNSFKGENFGYSYQSGKLNLFSDDSLTLTTLSNAFLGKLSEEQNFSEEIDHLQLFFENHLTPNPDQTLLISTDGIFTFLPWHLIFPDQNNIIRVHDLNAYFQTPSIDIQKTDITLFSYEDSQTLSNEDTLVFPKLPSAYKECMNIKQLMALEDHQVIAGSNFTEENFRAATKTNSLIHVSSHAYSDNKSRLSNFLAIRDDKGRGEKLHSYKIEQFTEAPKVIFLGACVTDKGMQRNGSGTYSLANAFTKIGTQTVLKTLWPINDQATAEFMNILYTEWNSGKSLQDALSHTRKHFKASGKPILDWAGFVLQGQGEVYLK